MTYPPQQPPTGPQQQPNYGQPQPGYPQPPQYGQPMQGQYPPRPKKRPVWPWILIAVVILACGGCFGFVGLVANSSNDDKKASNSNIAAAGSPVRDGKFEFLVTAVEPPVKTLGTGYAKADAKGEFIVIRVDVTNTGNEPRSYFALNQKLHDDQGREFANDSSAARAAQSETFESDLNPGFKISVAIVFDVPVGTVPASLELHDSAFSGGAKVALR